MNELDIAIVAEWLPRIPLWQRYQVTVDQIHKWFNQALRNTDLVLVSDTQEDNGWACGVAWCLPDGAFGRSAYLRLLGVRGGFSRRGIGTALLDHAEQLVAETCREIFLLVSDFNLDAQRFYRQHGYQQIGAIPGYVLPDVTEFLFWKSLRW